MWNLVKCLENQIFGPFFRTLRVLWDHQNRLLGTPKRLQNHVWPQLLLLNSTIAYLWQIDQAWSHLEQYRPRNHRKTLFLIFAKCSNGPFWVHQKSTIQHPKSISNLHLSTNALNLLKYSLLQASWPSSTVDWETSKNTFFSFWQKC